jgi:hypothetical protein
MKAKFNVDELERRPEFTPQGAMRPPAPPPQSAPAIPQHVSGHPKPAPPARRIETPRAETPPLRSVDETDMNVDTSEFADMEEDSFMDFEESILATKAGGNV